MCPNNYVRVISLDKPGKTRRQTRVQFGLTTPNQEKTEELVEDLKVILKITYRFCFVYN
jgi:ribulose bisphosphate carboxylase small subunit